MLRLLARFLLASALLGSIPVRAQDDPGSRRAAIEMMYPVMIQALEAKAFGRARNICEQAIIWEPQNAIHHYNLGCIEAQAGRIPQAIGALELAVALGFNDPQHLQNDPDLAPLRGESKYSELVRKVTANALAANAVAGMAIPDLTARPVAKSTAVAAEVAPVAPTTKSVPPAPNAFKDGRPVGLFFMTRFWPATGSLEKAAWYFAPDGTVYQNLESGFSPEDLAAHTGPKGNGSVKGDKLEVVWVDSKKTSSTLKLSASGTGFSWNAGIFSAVKPFEHAADVAGGYEGGESLAGASGSAVVSKRLELRPDGSFTWTGVSFATNTSAASRVAVGGTAGSAGRWQLDGLSLILTDTNGAVLRRIVFPYDDASTPLKPDRMFFGGILYKKQGDVASGRRP